MAGNNSFMTSLLALLDDDQFMKDAMSKPCPSTGQVDVTDYLSLVKEMLNLEGDQGQSKSLTSLSRETFVPLSSTINKLCCQITCEALHIKNARQTMESLFAKLSSFSWDAKAVLTLLAFSVYYAENWHLTETEKSDSKLGLVAMLRGRRGGKSAFVALKDLIRVTLEITKCTVEFANYSKGFGGSTSIDIRARFYQIIVGVLGCSVPFSGMISSSNEFRELDLSPFSSRITMIYESLKKQVEDFKQENENRLLYKKIKGLYRSTKDVLELMTVLFCTQKDSPTVYQCFKKTTVKVEVLQKKNVMLLISGLDLSNEDLITLTSIYNDSFRSSNYEIMWVPIADVIDHIKFQQKRSSMPWYSCNSIVSKPAAKFIKKSWQFKQQTKVVVLNQKGELVNMDAMTMIRLWGSKALPFTQERGCKLWDEHRNNWLELVVNNTVFQSVEQSFESKELIFLYGSAEDSKIVTEIENYLHKIKSHVSFSFKFFNINTKRKQFHSRLENCISSKMQVSTEMFDPLTQEQLKVYTSYKKQSGFAIITEGSRVIVNTSLTSLVKVLSQHEKWIKKGTNKQDFYTLFQAYYEKVIVKPQCHKFKIPNMVGNIPDHIKCPTPNCSSNMETIVTFKCCRGAH